MKHTLSHRFEFYVMSTYLFNNPGNCREKIGGELYLFKKQQTNITILVIINQRLCFPNHAKILQETSM